MVVVDQGRFKVQPSSIEEEEQQVDWLLVD